MKILVAATGGTIASVPMNNGKGTFTIALSGEELFTYFPELKKMNHDITIHSIMCKGSSNMTNEDVLQIANEVRKQAADYDGIIVTHGTDTMAYTASLLSYLLLDVKKPIVMTGSMLSAVEKGSDAQRNIYDSVRFLEKLHANGRCGVSVCIFGKLIHGVRTVKVHSWKKDAFTTIDYPFLGTSDGTTAHLSATVPAFADVTPFSSLERLENDIMPLSIFPSMDARLLEGIVDLSPKAIILEGFGVGGILYQLFPAVTRAVSCKIPVVIRTQALCGGTDLNMYDLGLKTAALGAISSGNMTREALIAKLKVALPLCSDNASLEKMLNTNYCDDIVVEDKAEC